MKALAESSSAAIECSPRGYSSVNGHDVLGEKGNRNRLTDQVLTPLGNFLADRFLACQIGVKGLFYDSCRKQLHLPPQPSGPEAIEFIVPEKRRIEIKELT